MILEEKADKTSPSSPSLSPASHYGPPSPGYYANSEYAPSSSGGSSSLRPPPHWPASSSQTALPLAGKPPPFPPLSATSSNTYLAVKPESSSLTRLPPSNLPRTPFQPMFLFAEQNSLRKGFPFVLPPSAHQPHPFALCDINETDWTQFLSEMRNVASLTDNERKAMYCVPFLSAIPLINIAIAGAIKHHIQGKKPALVSLLVDKWNHHFFHPRNIEVILMRGQTKLSGQSDQPVASLYTPRTVNFKPPPLADERDADDNRADGRDPDDRDKRSKHAYSNDKTYRLFVVSMEA